MAEEKKETPGYLISIQKVTSMSGESIQVSFNMPKESTMEDIDKEIIKLCEALDRRLVAQNEKVLAIVEHQRAAFDSLGDDGKGNTH